MSTWIKWPIRRGLSEKIAIFVALLVAASLATITAANMWSGQQLLEDRSRQRALDIATLLADASSNHLYDLRANEVQTLTEEVESQRDVLFAYVLDTDDMLLTESDEVGERYEFIDDPLSRRSRHIQEALIEVDDIGFHVAAPVFLGGDHLGVVRLALSRAPLDRDLSDLRRQSLFLGLAFLIVGLIASRSFVMRTVRPLQELTVATHAIAEGKMNRQISIQTGDEVQKLADAFNQMTMALNAKDAALTQRISDLGLMQQQLTKANQDLEERVAERTQELESALVTAKEATRLKSEFLANMSHEIRTPINGVLGMAELLTKSPLEGKQRHFANVILGSAQSLLGTINDILDFSKIEAGRLDLDSAPFDLRLLVEDVVQQLSAMAHQKRLELICDIAIDLHTDVRGDSQRLRQILVNLIGNAIKFTEQGEVAVRVRMSSGTKDSDILFEVSDTGIGIAPDAQARIFDSFAQADGSTSRQFGGTGLGLAISQKLVALMGGAMAVESTTGQGSTFRFTAKLERVAASPTTRTVDQRLRSLRILVLDDNDANRSILDRQLKAWNVPHTCAADGHSALELLRHAVAEDRPYDVVLVDYVMPAMDGLAFARLVGEERALADTRLVLLSSMTADKTSDAWHAAAFACSLTKPVRQSDLYHCLQSLNQGHDACAMSEGMEAADAVAEARFAANVLVAEDNAVNQDLIQEALRQLGCTITLVDDGFAAIRAFESGDHDLIFMDCQMPRVDGFQATQAIRDLEQGNGDRRRIPIVALTANAMEGDRDKCLAAGMDDYLSKPFMLADLIAALARWLPEGEAASLDPLRASSPTEAPAHDETPGIIDQAALNRIRQMAGPKGEELLVKIIGRYLEKTPELIDELAAAAARANYDEVRRVAHGLKSSSANLGAIMLSEQCKEVETACRIGGVDQVAANVEAIVAGFADVAAALRAERDGIQAQGGTSFAQSALVH
jgi:signal transduction histidine kinase/CheY-like chemotaxis protein/HPt (histidine-containing phosphotransfer) domain-containing protein